MKYYLRQVIFCSEVVGRSFLREMLVTDAVGQILDNEKLPPFYQMPLEQLREQDEMIVKLPMNFQVRGDHSCPFCGKQSCFYCRCGYLSCINEHTKMHVCPQCRDIFTKFGHCAAMMSPSGFVHGGEQRIPYYSGKNNRRIETERTESTPVDTFKKVYGFLDKLLPDDPAPKKNKALPSSDTKKLPWKKD